MINFLSSLFVFGGSVILILLLIGVLALIIVSAEKK